MRQHLGGDALTEEKQCPRCLETLPLESFGRDASSADGRQHTCKRCRTGKVAAYHRKHPRRRIFQTKRDTARRYGIPFSLRFEDVVWPSHCPVLGVELDYEQGVKGGRARANSPSFDRIDPRFGYVAGNVQIISNLANVMKSDANPEQLRRFAEWVLNTYPE